MLPRPKSIFDSVDMFPSVDTGVEYLQTEGYRKVVGLAQTRGGEYSMIMRGSTDPFNKMVVEAAAILSRNMQEWLDDNPRVAWIGMEHPHAPPRFIKDTGARLVLRGSIKAVRVPHFKGGDPKYTFTKHVYIGNEELFPVVVGTHWH